MSSTSTYSNAPRLGDEAPDFTAETTEGTLRFHEWLGASWGVPFAHLSVDTLESHRGWAADIEEARGRAPDFPVLADPDRVVSDLGGMVHPNASDTTTVRSVFVIGPGKKVRPTTSDPQSTGRSFPELLRAIDSLQLTAAHQVSTLEPHLRLVPQPS